MTKFSKVFNLYKKYEYKDVITDIIQSMPGTPYQTTIIGISEFLHFIMNAIKILYYRTKKGKCKITINISFYFIKNDFKYGSESVGPLKYQFEIALNSIKDKNIRYISLNL